MANAVSGINCLVLRKRLFFIAPIIINIVIILTLMTFFPSLMAVLMRVDSPMREGQERDDEGENSQNVTKIWVILLSREGIILDEI